MSLSLFTDYRLGASLDEAIDERGAPRHHYRHIVSHVDRIGLGGLESLQRNADLALLNQGITFTVYSDARGTEKIFPLDLLPRIITAEQWETIETGIVQRLTALNRFLQDVYGKQQILKDGVVPTDLIVASPLFCREMVGIRPAGGVHIHVAGVDLIQDEKGRFLVLEDNLRCPSGVSYVIENRVVSARVMPDLLRQHRVRGVDHYPHMLFEGLASLAPRGEPTIGVLTPGMYNSAYFEHTFLAAQMGVELVEGSDLLVDKGIVYMKTTLGLQQVDVIYRRVDDDFIDPLAFRADSVLGVPGLMHAYRAGNVVLANAPGNGVADDKAIYSYVPEIIRYYLSEEPILPQVPTYLCRDPKSCGYVLEHLEKMVVKPTDGSGGYGLIVGSKATASQLQEFRERLRAAPAKYVAQPIQKLSTHPTFVAQDGIEGIFPRHVDLRPFAVFDASGKVSVLPGGLTRVALPEGSLVVNSSQGGGSKDTWVLYPNGETNAHA